jgi:hypothetical protein
MKKDKELKAENKNGIKNKALPYEDSFVLRPLKQLVVIINRYQGDYFMDAFKEIGVSASFLSYGEGTATSDLRHILGIGEDKKDIVFSLVTDDNLEKCLNICRERFSVSKDAKGIAFTIKVDSIVSVLAYKFLTDTRQNRRK